MRVLVVGASAGIGRAVAEEAERRGHGVVAAARRGPVVCDVRDPASCDAVVAEAVAALGGLDWLVVAAGASPLARLAGSDEELWRRVVDTNLVGAALLTRAALPHLKEARGRALYMSVVSPGRPWPWLVPYFASKAGMEEMVRGWRAEEPGVGFVTVSVGPTVSEFAAGWDDASAQAAFAAWHEGGYLPSADVMTPEQVAGAVLDVLASPVRVPDLRLMPDPGGAP